MKYEQEPAFDGPRLKNEIHELIRAFPEMTVAETIGWLELVKFELIRACPENESQ